MTESRAGSDDCFMRAVLAGAVAAVAVFLLTRGGGGPVGGLLILGAFAGVGRWAYTRCTARQARGVARSAPAPTPRTEAASTSAPASAAPPTPPGPPRPSAEMVRAAMGLPAPAKPTLLPGPRDGAADDLKLIKGIGPKLETMLNRMGVHHFDQIAAWTAAEIAWVDDNLEGFRGRVTRDGWVGQAKALAAGGVAALAARADRDNAPTGQG